MKCPKCGQEMVVASRNENQVLWKCRNPECGHMTLVQDWDRNDVS